MPRRRNRGPESRRKSPEKSTEELNLNPEGLKNLGALLEQVSQHLESKLGIKMSPDHTISMDWFAETDYYTEEEVERDKAYVADREAKFARKHAAKGPDHEKRHKIAEAFEEAVPVIFHYALQAKGLSVVKTTRHTDIAEKVDCFVLHGETGQVICAIDETNSNIDNVIDSKKLDNVIEGNENGEERIKYGIALNPKDKKWYPSELKRENAPLAYLSMPRERILKFIKDLADIDVTYEEDVEELCDDFFTDLIHSLYQSLDHIMRNMPKQHDKMNDLINLLHQETGLDPNLSYAA